MTFTHTIVTASDCVGLTLPGIIDEPGSLAGKINSLASFCFIIGVCGGAGAAMVGIVPTQSLVSRWFLKRRGTVLSIAYSGQGVGVMLLAPGAQLAIQEFGWQDAYQLGGYGFIFILILNLGIYQRIFLHLACLQP